MKLLLCLVLSVTACLAEDGNLGPKDIALTGGLPLEQLIGKKFKGVGVIEIARSVPVVYFAAPTADADHAKGRSAHLITMLPDNEIAKLKEGTKVEVESIIVDHGYGALMMYLYALRPLE